MKTHEPSSRVLSNYLCAISSLVLWLLLPPLVTTCQAGGLRREVFTNVFGMAIADLTNNARFPDHPDLVDSVASFETPSQFGDNYGERLTGYLLPPVTGDYVFYVASDDQGALFLSPDSDPAHKTQIACETAWSMPRSWTGMGAGWPDAAKISMPIHLEGGRAYFVEALHKEGGGGDNFAVAWRVPGGPPPENGSDPIAGEFLSIEPPLEPELHVVGIYSGIYGGGGSSNHEEGQASVVVNRPGRRVTLMLNAYEPVLWSIIVSNSTVIERILLGGYYQQRVQGVGAEIPVLPYWSQGRQGASIDIGYSLETGRFYQEVSIVHAITGLEIASFHGGHLAPYPTPFVIDSVQNDPRLRSDYPQPVPASELPDLSFQLTFFNGSGPGQGIVFQKDYTLQGPRQPGQLLPAMRVVPDAARRYYYAANSQGPLRIDSTTGLAEGMTLGTGVPALSWPMGMAFDSFRNRELLVSLGGEGCLYSYAPASNLWSLVASMQNRDLDSLVYHAPSDEIYGLEVFHSDYPPLRIDRFSATGVFRGQIDLPLFPWNIGVSGYQSELVSVGDYLVVLIAPVSSYYPGTQPQDSRMYLIDPRSNQVWLAYRQYVPGPNQPPGVAITAPTNGSLFSITNIALTARAWDPDGSISSVEFYAGLTRLGQAIGPVSTSGDYSLVWSNALPGAYSLTARATDLTGLVTTSAPVVISVVGTSGPPDLSFDLAFFTSSQAAVNGQVFWRHFTASGPDQGQTLLPGMRVVPDAGGRYFYAAHPHVALKVDSLTGTASEMSLGPGVPELSWPTGMAFDSRRNRELLVSFGGEGYLYAYAPEQDRWSQVSSMNNRDVGNLVYHAPQDALYGLGVFERVLYRFSSQGAYQSEFPLASLPPIGLSSYQCELVSAGANLVLLIGPDQTQWSSGLREEWWMYVFEPQTSRLQLLWHKVHGSENTAPSLGLNAPAHGSQSGIGMPLRLQALARDNDGTVASVEFFASNQSLGFGTRTPGSDLFELNWTPASPGTIKLQALATDNDGRVTLSSPIDITIQPPTPMVVWDKPADIMYGNALSAVQLNALAAVPGSFAYDPPAGTRLHAGIGQRLTAIFTPQDSQYYSRATNYVTINVSRAPLVIRADDKSRRQGAPNPPLTASYEFFYAGDSPANLETPATLSTTATANSFPGAYPIIVGGATDSDYDISFEKGTLFVRSSKNLPGYLDLAFDVGLAPWSRVESLARQADGKILIGGWFRTLGEVGHTNLIRIDENGSIDPSFHADSFSDDQVLCVAVQPDGKILVGSAGWYSDMEGQIFGLKRLNPDGSPDASFHAGKGEGDWGGVRSIALQNDDRILIGGMCMVGNRQIVARLFPDGSVDPSFNPGAVYVWEGDDEVVRDLVVQRDGKILVRGDISEIQGKAVRGLFRLEPDGNLDLSFVFAEGPVNSILLQPDGRILIGGYAMANSPPGFYRLNSDGRLDPTFRPTDFSPIAPSALAMQWDGKILAAGPYPGIQRVGPVRLWGDGSADTTFDSGLGADWEIRRILVLPNQRILIAGTFTTVDGVPRRGIARLFNDPLNPESFVRREINGDLVKLRALPPSGTESYFIQDQPPAGWSIQEVSNGGEIDPVSGRIQFGPFTDRRSRALEYRVTPPPGFGGVGLFAGIAVADGVPSVISGDDRMVVRPRHPADGHPADWTIDRVEAGAYAASWRTGGTWVLPPVPIPVDYVARAAAISKSGGVYSLDPRAQQPPLCWVTPRLSDHARPSTAGSGGIAHRQLPAHFVPGEPVEITVHVVPRRDILAWALEESLPPGWRVLSSSEEGSFDQAQGKLKWGPFYEATPRTVRYRIVPGPAINRRARFNGAVSFDGTLRSVQGPSETRSSSRLAWAAGPEHGRWDLQLEGDPGARYAIEVSSDLLNWTPLVSVTNKHGTVVIPRSALPEAHPRFYRARLLEDAPGISTPANREAQ